MRTFVCKILYKIKSENEYRMINENSNRFLAYLEANDLLSDRQYGFRRNQSAGDLLGYATFGTLGVSLDISKPLTGFGITAL